MLQVPPNVEVINGHWLCIDTDGVGFLYTPGEGFWGFYLTDLDAARRTASVVCGGICLRCECEIRHHDNEAATCDKCGQCSGLFDNFSRGKTQ